MWTDLGHGEVLDSEQTSNRFQGEVHAGREETFEVRSNLRFLGRCPPILGWVARQFLGWSPVSLSRDLSCARKLGLCGRRCKCSCRTERPETCGTDVPRHQARGQRVPGIKKLEPANIGRVASRCHCQLNKDDIILVLAHSRGEARCLKHREVKGSSLLLWFAYGEQSCLVSLLGAASRRLLLGCGWHLLWPENALLEEQTEAQHCTACWKTDGKGKQQTRTYSQAVVIAIPPRPQ